jgi:hypothetical protein
MPASRLALLALPLALLACDPSVHRETLEFDAADLQALVLDGGSGDIVVIGDPEAESVDVVALVRGGSTQLHHAMDDGTLKLSMHCPRGARTCSVDWFITVPPHLDVELDTGSGDIEASDLTGKLWLDTGSGDIRLADLAAPTIDAATGSGDVTGHRIACDDFDGSAGSGDLELELSDRPRRVAWESGSGDVEVSLPSGLYDLAISTGSGDVDTSGIDDAPDADALLSLSTGSGDVSLIGR